MLHAVVALLCQAVIGFATGNWWAGAAAAIGFFVGREHAQAEYRWIERYGFGVRANMPWSAPFDLKVWNAKSATDVIAPTIAVLVVAFFV